LGTDYYKAYKSLRGFNTLNKGVDVKDVVDPNMQYANGGTTGEDFAYDRWRRSLPENLQSESPSYNLRGYWESLGKPEKFEPFNYDLYGGEYDGPNGEFLYHGFSRNPETGEILKGKLHPTLNKALNDVDEEGNVYLPYLKNNKLYTNKIENIKKYPNGGEYKEMFPNIPGVYIKDSRKIRATTGKKIKPTRDLISGYY
ncbi:MAG: hypothetical protein ACK559_42260, partial [bacterium]